MLLSIELICVLAAIFVFFVVAGVGVLIIVKQKTILKRKSEGATKEQEIFDEYIGKDVNVVLKKVGINPTEYYSFCNIAGVKPNLYSLIFSRIISLVLLFGAVFCYIFFQNLYYMTGLLLISLLIMKMPTAKVKKIATARKAAFNAEIPRFLDMLDSALIANMPIANAIEFTTKYLDGVLCEELKYALAETEMGAKNWNEALFDVANKYDNNNFSDFALDITTAYNKGVSIIESVERKSRQIKESNTLKAKEKAASVSSSVMLPMMFFKMMPVLALFILPVTDVMGTAF